MDEQKLSHSLFSSGKEKHMKIIQNNEIDNR